MSDPMTKSQDSYAALNIKQSEGYVEKQILEYLDNVRGANVVTMFDYVPNLQLNFELDEAEAKAFICLWLRSFSERFLCRQIKPLSRETGYELTV